MKSRFGKILLLTFTFLFLLSIHVVAEQQRCPQCGDSLSRWEKYNVLSSSDPSYLIQHQLQFYYTCNNYNCRWESGVVDEETGLKNHSILSANSQIIYKDNKSNHLKYYKGTCSYCKANDVLSNSSEENHQYNSDQIKENYVKKDAKYHNLVQKKICKYCKHEESSTLKTTGHSFKWIKSDNKIYNSCTMCGYSRASTAAKAKKVSLKLKNGKSYTIKLDKVSKYDAIKKVDLKSKYYKVIKTTSNKVKIKVKSLPAKGLTIKITMKSGKIYQYKLIKKK